MISDRYIGHKNLTRLVKSNHRVLAITLELAEKMERMGLVAMAAQEGAVRPLLWAKNSSSVEEGPVAHMGNASELYPRTESAAAN